MFYDSAMQALVQALRKREEFWKVQYNRLDRNFKAREGVLNEEKDRLENDFLAYTLYGIKGDSKDRITCCV